MEECERDRSGPDVRGQERSGRSTPRPSRAAAIALAVAVLGGVASSASAEPAGAGAAVALATAIPGESPDSVALLGPSGQIYVVEQGASGDPSPAAGEWTWRRRYPGGIAAQVESAVRAPDGAIFALGPRSPMFRLAAGVWHVHPLPNRGRVRAAGWHSHPAVAIGPHVYLWHSAGWTRLASARTRITALFGLPGTPEVVVATESGRIWRFGQRSRRTIRHPLPIDDPVVAMIGRAGQPIYAWSRSGVLLELDRRSARPVAGDATVEGFLPQAGTIARSGVVWLAGTLPASADGARPRAELVLARLAGGALALAGKLDAIQDGDRVIALHARGDGSLLVATKNGVIRLRSSDGSWQNGKLVDQLSKNPPRPPGPGPARAH